MRNGQPARSGGWDDAGIVRHGPIGRNGDAPRDCRLVADIANLARTRGRRWRGLEPTVVEGIADAFCQLVAERLGDVGQGAGDCGDPRPLESDVIVEEFEDFHRRVRSRRPGNVAEIVGVDRLGDGRVEKDHHN